MNLNVNGMHVVDAFLRIGQCIWEPSFKKDLNGVLICLLFAFLAPKVKRGRTFFKVLSSGVITSQVQLSLYRIHICFPNETNFCFATGRAGSYDMISEGIPATIGDSLRFPLIGNEIF